jgi:hypothetical protein
MSALGALVFIGIGVAIVSLRPDRATWGFFLFCIGYAPASQAVFNLVIPAPWVLYGSERGVIRLGELHWSRDDAPTGLARPALALPITVRHELEAIGFFGGHRGGEDFDPDELQWLNSLAAAAGAAYDHLAADALRQELERITRENESQRLTLERNGLLAT